MPAIACQQVASSARPSMALCSVDGCPYPVRTGGLCDGHMKRRMRGEVVSTPLAPRPRGMDRYREAALAYANAEGDDEFKRAEDNLRKSAAAARADAISELSRAALARLRLAGMRLGRPPLVDPEVALRTHQETGSVKRTAERLGVSCRTVRRALRRARN